ncbi:MAG: MFS transporter [Bulleidia sp.]
MSVLKKGPTIRYSILQAGYFMDCLVITNFAALFLSGRGFTTGQIGIATSLSALISCVFAQLFSIMADKSEHIPLKYYLIVIMSVCVAAFAGLAFLPHTFLPTMMFFLTAMSLQSALSPFITSLCLQFTNNGYHLNFGFARSIGSLGYAMMALVMGNVTEMFGSEVIIPVFAVIYACLIAFLIFFPVPVKDNHAKAVAGNAIVEGQPSTMKQFVHRYHRFFVLNAGFILFWFMNNLLGTYMIYFIKDLGGTTADVGTTLFVMAFSEIPAVMFGSNIMARIGAGKMLMIAMAGGVLKSILFFIAHDITFWIFLNITHILMSGFYQVSAVYYVYSIIGKKDIVKGQSLMGIATAGICPMLSNFLGGFMMETMPHRMILFVGILINIAAMVIVMIALDPNRFQNDYRD